jgi:Serine dehydrogenase proteinase
MLPLRFNPQIMKDIFSAILDLKKIRKGVPQFLLKSGIEPNSTISVRVALLKYRRDSPDLCEEVDLIVESPGGLADDAYRIIKAFRKTFKTVNVVVPFWAKSAATLMSLGATKIIIDEAGEFGPLDAQLGKARNDSPEMERESALNDEHSLRRIEARYKEMYESIFVRIYEHRKINIPKDELSKQIFENLSKFYEPLMRQIDPYKLGEKRRKLDIGAQYAKIILAQFGQGNDQNKIREFIDFLVNQCPDHGFVIDYDLISQFIDNVHLPSIFGDDYKEKLNDLSLLLLQSVFFDEEDNEYCGFIVDELINKDPSSSGSDLKDNDTENEAVKHLNGNNKPSLQPLVN